MLRRKPLSVILFLFPISLVVFGFVNCSSPFEESQTWEDRSEINWTQAKQKVDTTEMEMRSLAIFEKTLYINLQENCASCHGTLQEPLFADAESLVSHQFLIENEMVDFEQPESSMLVLTLREEHEGLPLQIADQLARSITSWASGQSPELLDAPEGD